MDEEVADFGENEADESDFGLLSGRSRVERMIDQVSDPRGEAPVVTAILE